jgi:hypothetical protein
MKRVLPLLVLAIFIFPLIALAGNDNKGASLFQDMKKAGRAAKEAARDAGKEIKKDAKRAGKELKKTGKEAKKEIKKTGKEARKSEKGLAGSFKKAFKRVGKTASDAWHGFLDFLGFGKEDKNMKKEKPAEHVLLYATRVA